MKPLLSLPLIFAVSAMAQDSQPLIIAHRGASGYLPEHTLEAKAMAHGQGAHFLEQDVVLTKDSVPVVLHDVHVDTVSDVAARFPDRKRADGRYYALDLTLAELKQLRVHERTDAKTGRQVFPKRFPQEIAFSTIPTLEEELQFIQGLNRSTGRKAGVYPEIKQPKWHREQGYDVSAVVIPLLHKYGYANKTDLCYVQCFELEEIKRLRAEHKWQGRLIMLMGGGAKGSDGTDFQRLRSEAGLAELAGLVDGVGPALTSVIQPDRTVAPWIRQAQAAGLEVHPYTLRVDELPKFAESAGQLMDLLFDKAGVQGLFTDFPDVALKWTKKR